VCFNLDGMTKAFSIEIGDDATSHNVESSIFDNFRQIIAAAARIAAARLTEIEHESVWL
jgi:hypothetical protein